jgi:WD40 repeat protein/serine/threonine protein kinase
MPDHSLPQSVQLQLEGVCNRFEAAWKAAGSTSSAPRIAEFVGGTAEPGRTGLLRELLRLDLEYRRRQGEDPLAEGDAAYLERVCGDDPALRVELEGLLAARDEMGRVVGSPVALSPTSAHRPLREGPGTRIGPYKLLQKLGEGGMGTVWMAEQEEPVQRRVALKVIKVGRDGGQVLARFEAERQALALMDHPNIARVLDAGETGSGRPYFVMELVRGIPITRYCDQEHLTPQERLALFIPVCQAVQHAHQKGIIHRDLKPSNVIVALYDGVPVPKVIDFGVAKVTAQKLTEHTLFTEVGQIVGTLEYMSPEQAELNNLDIDTRADIYSLGVLLYELLTGSPPFTSKQLRSAAFTEMLRIIREVEPQKPSTKLSSSDELPSIAAKRKLEPRRLTRLVHGDLDWIVMKCLEKERGRRYETANALAMELQRYLADEPVLAGPPGAGYRLRKFVHRHRGSVLATGLLLLALLCGITGTTLGLVRAERARQAEADARQAEEEARRVEEELRQVAQAKEQEAVAAAGREAEQRQLAEAQRDEAKRLRAESQRNLYFSHLQLAKRAWDDAEIPRAVGLLEEHAAPLTPSDADLRGFEWHYLKRLCHSDLLTLEGHTRVVKSVRFNPDGQRLASASYDQTVKVWDIRTGQTVLTLKGHTGAVFSVCFSPDGQRLASAGDETIKVWDAQTGQELLTLKGHTRSAWGVCFSPNGQRLASASWDKTVKVWNAQTGQEMLTLKGHISNVNSVCFSPDGERLVSAGNEAARVWDAETGKEIFTLKGHTGTVQCVCFSPDGKRLASASVDQTVKVWNAQTGQEILTLRGHADWVNDVCFSPDGQRLASGSRDRTIKVWDAQTGQEVLSFKGSTFTVDAVCFSPDGRRLASSDLETVKVWDAQADQEALTLKLADTPFSICFSPDSRRLASADGSQQVTIWDARTGLEMCTLKGGRTLGGGQRLVNGGVCFSPDGRRLASAVAFQALKIWDVQTGEVIHHITVHFGSAYDVCFSPDGQCLASAFQDGTVRVWDVRTGLETIALRGHTQSVYRVRFSPDGQRLASASQDSTVKLWDARTGQEAFTLQGHTGAVWEVCFSPDGQRLASAGSDQTVKIWDARTGQESMTIKTDAKSVCFSPDGLRLASAGAQTVKVWDAQTGQEALTLKERGLGAAAVVCFSPDGQRLAGLYLNHTVKVWDARPLSPEVQTECAARGLVRFLHSRPLPNAGILAALRADQTISEPVRKEALIMAERLPDDPLRYNTASWAIVSRPGASPEQTLRALEWAETACRLQPENGNHLNTLGVAQYRAGKFVEALQSLQRSDELNRARLKYARPADLAFLAMTCRRLGKKDQAQEYLDQLHKAMAEPRWKNNEEGKRFLQEAEAVLKQPEHEEPWDAFASEQARRGARGAGVLTRLAW